MVLHQLCSGVRLSKTLEVERLGGWQSNAEGANIIRRWATGRDIRHATSAPPNIHGSRVVDSPGMIEVITAGILDAIAPSGEAERSLCSRLLGRHCGGQLGRCRGLGALGTVAFGNENWT